MSLQEHFKNYSVHFDFLEKDLPEKTIEKYYLKWSKKFSDYLSENPQENAIILACRCRRARKEVVSSAQLWSEAIIVKENGCLSAYFFLCYYALFHAILSVLYLNTDINEKIVSLTHSKLENVFCDYYAKGDDAIFDPSIKEYIELCKHYRETYSYNLPYNTMYANFNENQLRTIILKCFQLANLNAWILSKKIHPIRPSSSNHQFIRNTFLLYNARLNNQGKYELDDAEQNALSEALHHGVSCEPFEIELGHDWDEMGYSASIEPLFDKKAVYHIKANALSFVYEAIRFL